ncbi:hypothetical protein XENORESO_017982 [Xenotaenia resolanae]|uniref:Uncharacterized protein n=1 Tax=Xenotaenia resolanae TaxID=208358 RepID=A0ABV0XAK2_9TELE
MWVKRHQTPTLSDTNLKSSWFCAWSVSPAVLILPPSPPSSLILQQHPSLRMQDVPSRLNPPSQHTVSASAPGSDAASVLKGRKHEIK